MFTTSAEVVPSLDFGTRKRQSLSSPASTVRASAKCVLQQRDLGKLPRFRQKLSRHDVSEWLDFALRS